MEVDASPRVGDPGSKLDNITTVELVVVVEVADVVDDPGVSLLRSRRATATRPCGS